MCIFCLCVDHKEHHSCVPNTRDDRSLLQLPHQWETGHLGQSFCLFIYYSLISEHYVTDALDLITLTVWPQRVKSLWVIITGIHGVKMSKRNTVKRLAAVCLWSFSQKTNFAVASGQERSFYHPLFNPLLPLTERKQWLLAQDSQQKQRGLLRAS